MRLETYRRQLERDGEVSIGAYARRQRRRRLAIALLGVAMIAAAIATYLVLNPKRQPSNHGLQPVRLSCASCEHRADERVSFEQTFPTVCPQCGEKALRPMWKCRACQAEFTPTSDAEPRRCPKCGSNSVGSAMAP